MSHASKHNPRISARLSDADTGDIGRISTVTRVSESNYANSASFNAASVLSRQVSALTCLRNLDLCMQTPRPKNLLCDCCERTIRINEMFTTIITGLWLDVEPCQQTWRVPGSREAVRIQVWWTSVQTFIDIDWDFPPKTTHVFLMEALEAKNDKVKSSSSS